MMNIISIMKKVFTIIAVFLVLFSCSTASDSTEVITDQIVRNFATGLETGDIEILMSTYHPDAEFTFIDSDGEKNILTGAKDIRAAQQANFDQEIFSGKVMVDTWKKEKKMNSVIYRVIVPFGNFQFMNTLELTMLADKWGIIRQQVEFYSFE